MVTPVSSTNVAATPSEIPFNYTSADDELIVHYLLGTEVWQQIEQLRLRRVTGQSARLLMRVFGDVFIHRRNAYLFQDLLDSPRRRRRLFRRLETELDVVESHAGDEPLVDRVLAATRGMLEDFRREVAAAPGERRRIAMALAPIVGRNNVCFDPFTLVAHATDATDWRSYLPLAVVTPTDEAQVAALLAALARLDLRAVPRGAGTGLTGGAVPLAARCVVLNTEKLDHIRGIEERELFDGDEASRRVPVMSLESGVITERAIDAAASQGYVFATDPTSAWACTIGGNIAENAGGKTAVLWGTCIDNVLAWRMALPSGESWTIERRGHPLRKILPDDEITWDVRGDDGAVRRTVTLRGDAIRRPGLWKDITNKALGGLPGMQKEGTDGVITSAEFVLYRQYEASATLCLEFFGSSMDEASEVILALSRAFPNQGEEVLQALEHFDEEYVRAIGYKVKASRAEAPKAVLLIDIVGHTPEQVARGVETVSAVLAPHANTELFLAADAAEAKRFWADRKQLGAIAARTNAFKLNEDIVLPLTALAPFARWCDVINVDEERYNQLELVARVRDVIERSPAPDGAEDAAFAAEKMSRAIVRCDRAVGDLHRADDAALRETLLLAELKRDLLEMLRGYTALSAAVNAAWEHVRSRRIVLATHMHAGDGNVHVNIPVMSNDRAMMRRAEQLVDRVMEQVASLGGVCSGEHGIGITKLKYLGDDALDALAAYRREIDPQSLMNPGKLASREAAQQVFTPSFNLLEIEARILQHGKLEQLALKIATCIRCGKCKADCCVFHPARGLFFHPRNKNLAIGALIEALLYQSQRERSSSFELLRHLREVADHCTICHKCLKPCPVNIDTGEVSVLEREILAARGQKRTPLATRATLRYLDSRSPAFNALFRAAVVRGGGAVQRSLSRVVGGVGDGHSATSYPLQLLRSPGPKAERKTLRDELPACEPHQALVLSPEAEPRSTVFYFPGCGSERLYASVSLAALHLLCESGSRVVLPPPFLCCGFPAWANAAGEQHGRNTLRDTIVFSQIREMCAHMRFDAVVVTCGTCRESLAAMDAGKVFGAPVLDVSRFLHDRGLRIEGAGDLLYHTPCHDSLDGRAQSVLEGIAGLQLTTVPHCCSEAGTLSLSRPDIADAMLDRKREAFERVFSSSSNGEDQGRRVLTSCPSCLSGLGRQAALGIEPRHVVVELAERLSGASWREKARIQAARAETVHF